MELNLFFPKLWVTLIVVAFALISGYRNALGGSLRPTLGDTIIGALKTCPFLLGLGIPFVWML